MLLYIPQISRVPGFFGSGFGTVVARCSDMEVFAGAHAAFAPQIPRLVNVESVFSFGQLRKGDF
jgi:hypothetical protein